MTTEAAHRAILDAFFSAGNDAQPSDAAGWVARFQQSGAGVLPCRRGGQSYWFGFSTDERRARALRDELRAFIGPTWSTWTGPSAELDLKDPVEAAVKAASRGPVVRLEPVPGHVTELEGALALMAEVLDRRPDLRREGPRPRHRVLSEFELALTARNADRAEELIAELERLGSLSSVNLLFLRIRCLDAAGDYPALLDHPSLPDLLRRRRPRAVTEVIAHAVESVFVAPHQARWLAGDRDAATAAAEDMSQLDASFGAVLGAPGLEHDREAAAAAVIHHLLTGDNEGAAGAVTRWHGDAYGDWLEALVTAHTATSSPLEPAPAEAPPGLEPPPPGTSAGPALRIEEAQNVGMLFTAGQYQDALLAAVARKDPSAEDVAIAVRSAYNLDTLTAAAQAIDLVTRAPEEAQRVARRDRMVREAEREMQRLLDTRPKWRWCGTAARDQLCRVVRSGLRRSDVGGGAGGGESRAPGVAIRCARLDRIGRAPAVLHSGLRDRRARSLFGARRTCASTHLAGGCS